MNQECHVRGEECGEGRKKHKTPGLHGMPGACVILEAGLSSFAVVCAGAQPRWLGKLLAATAGRSNHLATAAVVAAVTMATLLAAALPGAALFAATLLGATLFAAALPVATAAVIVATAAGGLGFAGRGHGFAGGGNGGAGRSGAARGGLRTAVIAAVVAAAIAVAAILAATFLGAALLAATLTVAAVVAAAIVAAADGGGVAAAGVATTHEEPGGVDGRSDTQQTGSQGRHEKAIHCRTPKNGTYGDGNGNNLSPEPPAPRCSRRCGRPRR